MTLCETLSSQLIYTPEQKYSEESCFRLYFIVWFMFNEYANLNLLIFFSPNAAKTRLARGLLTYCCEIAYHREQKTRNKSVIVSRELSGLVLDLTCERPSANELQC